MPPAEKSNIPQPSENDAADQAADIRGLIHTLLDRVWIIALLVTLSVLAAVYYVRQAPRIYQATATVQVEQEERKVVKVEQVMREDLRSLELLNTIVQKFRSRALLEMVVATNKLANNPKFIGTATNDSAIPFDPVSRLEKMVKTSLRRNTRLIDISVDHTDPQLAADIANTLVEQYSVLDSGYSVSTTKGAAAYLLDETTRLKKKLEVSEQALQKYREEVGMVSLQQNQEVIGPLMRDFTAKLSQAHADVERLQLAYDSFAKLTTASQQLTMLPLVEADPSVLAARADASHLEQEFQVLRLRYKEKHPKYISASRRVEEAQKAYASVLDGVLNKYFLRAVETARVDLESAKLVEAGLKKSLEKLDASSLKFSQQAIMYGMLSREVDADRALFESLLNRLKETSLTSDIQQDKIRTIQAAVPPTGPISPKTMMILMLAVLGGLMGGVMLALGQSAMDTSITNVEQAETFFKLPVLSAVPKLKEVKKGKVLIVAAEGSVSTGAEVFRTLRTSLSMLGRAEDRRTFLFTSSFPQEGKTFSSANFATSLAQQGLRTLLIDADLRRPSVENFMTTKTGKLPGLSDILLGQKKLDEVLQTQEGIENLTWVAAGRVAPNPSELLAQGGFSKLIDEALQKYDRVVVDSAPIHAVSDTLLIVRKIQTTVLVIHGNKTPRKPILRSLQLLQNAGANVGGLLLNLVPVRRGRGYYYDSYYHGYYHGYGYGHDKNKAGDKNT